jgi:phosphatidate cytidylyltransferase
VLPRVASGLLFAVVFLFGLFSSRSFAPHIVFVIVAVATLLGTREYYSLARKKSIRPSPWPGYAVALAFVADSYFLGFSHFVHIFIACFWLLLMTQVFFKRVDFSIANTATSLFGSVYVGLPMAILLCVFRYPQRWYPSDLDVAQAGGNLLLFLFLTSWMTDIGGYLIGKPLGRHKMSPVLSPNKSVEGFVGGLVFSVVAGLALVAWFPGMRAMFNWWEAALLPVLLCVTGTLGDLSESAFKRDAQVKDSGRTYTGHGGMLDIIDSMLLCAPVFFLYLELARPLFR